ncbi:hypothetical protein Q8F57_033345 [Paraburkholderia terrae]|nr:hypothetical protein [Paraburkholderia terrae]MDW3662810.1 hypothetical protein [Paraburkholderia terrae]
MDKGKASQGMVCAECDAGWADVYTLTGYSDIEGGVDLEAVEAVEAVVE